MAALRPVYAGQGVAVRVFGARQGTGWLLGRHWAQVRVCFPWSQHRWIAFWRLVGCRNLGSRNAKVDMPWSEHRRSLFDVEPKVTRGPLSQDESTEKGVSPGHSTDGSI